MYIFVSSNKKQMENLSNIEKTSVKTFMILVLVFTFYKGVLMGPITKYFFNTPVENSLFSGIMLGFFILLIPVANKIFRL